MVTPRGQNIQKRAEELWLEDLMQKGYITTEVPTTPEIEELKEGGFWKRAQHDLMRSEATKLKQEEEAGRAEERTWMFGRGQELGLTVLEEPIYRNMQKRLRLSLWSKRAFRQQFRPKAVHNISKIISSPTVKMPRISFPIQQTPRRIHRHHTQRSSKTTMRSIRHLKHVKVFAFPDSVWKVRK